MTESQRSADLETKRQALIASLPEAARGWLKNSLEHDRREFQARASKVRRRFDPAGNNAQYATASELIAQAYDQAAWAFTRALNGLLRPGDMAKSLSEDGQGGDTCAICDVCFSGGGCEHKEDKRGNPARLFRDGYESELAEGAGVDDHEVYKKHGVQL